MRAFHASSLIALGGALAFASAPAASAPKDEAVAKQARGGARSGGSANRNRGAGTTANTNRTNTQRGTANRNTTNANRSTNVNNTNVNVNRNVNVNVDNDNRIYGDGEIDRRPVRNAMVVGAMVRALPGGCPPVIVAAVTYYSCGGAWYRAQSGQYVVVAPPQ